MYRRKRNTRRNTRWNYSSKGWYFLTIVTKFREPRFGFIANGAMHHNTFGLQVLAAWEDSKVRRPHMRFESIVVMPDHVQMLVHLNVTSCFVSTYPVGVMGKRLKRSVSSYVALFKGACTRAAQEHLGIPLRGTYWQRGYDDQIIRTPQYKKNVIRYIRDNPMNEQIRIDACARRR